MKKLVYLATLVLLLTSVFNLAHAVKNFNSSKSNTVTAVSAQDEVTNLINKAKKEALQMSSAMIRLERNGRAAGNVKIEVTVGVKITPVAGRIPR